MIKCKTARQGFSLVELLVIVALVAILSAIAYPNFSQWLSRSRLKAAARDLYSDMQKAKLTAIKDNTTIGMQFSPVTFPAQGGGYTVFVDDGSGGGIRGNSIQDGSESTLWSKAMTHDISLVNAAFGAASSFAFTPNGVVAQSRSGNAQLRITELWSKVTVSASGGLKIEISADGDTWN